MVSGTKILISEIREKNNDYISFFTPNFTPLKIISEKHETPA